MEDAVTTRIIAAKRTGKSIDMAPKRPSAKMLEAELAGTVRDIYNGSERDELTVNLVRERVESKLGLDDGFFKRGEWKVKSKDVIKDTVVSAMHVEHREAKKKRGLDKT